MTKTKTETKKTKTRTKKAKAKTRTKKTKTPRRKAKKTGAKAKKVGAKPKKIVGFSAHALAGVAAGETALSLAMIEAVQALMSFGWFGANADMVCASIRASVIVIKQGEYKTAAELMRCAAASVDAEAASSIKADARRISAKCEALVDAAAQLEGNHDKLRAEVLRINTALEEPTLHL